jgi:hypothetical protein
LDPGSKFSEWGWMARALVAGVQAQQQRQILQQQKAAAQQMVQQEKEDKAKR